MKTKKSRLSGNKTKANESIADKDYVDIRGYGRRRGRRMSIVERRRKALLEEELDDIVRESFPDGEREAYTGFRENAYQGNEEEFEPQGYGYDFENVEDDDFDLDDEDFDEEEEMSEIDVAALREVIETATRQRRKHQSNPAPESLVGKCLVHIGDTSNELYKQSVIYITESSKEVVRGVMINKLLFGSATIECKTKGNETILKNVYEDLYQGGPENPANGVVIFPTGEDTVDDPFADIQGDISISTSFGVLQEIMDGQGPSKKIIAMGHCVWHRGELEWELFNNQWLIIPSSPKLMFDTKFEDRWEFAKQQSGVYRGAFIPQIGLA